MKDLKLKITITDGEKKVVTTSINVDDYKSIKDLHNVSLLDTLVDELLNQIETHEEKNL